MIWQIVLGNLVFWGLCIIPLAIVTAIIELYTKYKSQREYAIRTKTVIDFLRRHRKDLTNVDYNELYEVITFKKDEITQNETKNE